MSELCAITKCNRASRWLCDCCQQNLCLQHLNEHNTSLISQLNPLTDEINALGNRLQTINIQKIVGVSRQKLEEWCEDCHQTIDRFFKQKCQELDQLADEKVEKQNIEISQIRSKMAKLIEEQETTRQDIDSIKSDIRYLEKQMYNIEELCFQINTRPLVINDDYIHIRETSQQEIDLSTLTPVHKTISRSNESYTSLASNDRYLLLHRTSYLCLIDREMNIVKQVPWPYSAIWDMCWSPTLDRFIVIEKSNIFLVDANTMSIDSAKTIDKRKWYSCTFSDTFLFLSTLECGSSIVKFSTLPLIKLVREWKSPNTCTKDELIHGVACNDGMLALLVMNRLSKIVHIELKSSETLNRIWLLRLNIVWNEDIAIRCCALTCNEWLVSDYTTGHLLHVTKDGKMKKTTRYNPSPRRVILFGSNSLVVSTNINIQLHKFLSNV